METSDHSSRPLPFSISSSGSVDRSVLRQYNGSGVPLVSRGDDFPCSERGSAAPTPLDRVASDFSCASIYRGHEESHGGFFELSSTGPQLQVDPGSGCSDGASGQVVGDCRSFCYLSELSPSGVLFSIRQSMSALTDAFLQSWDSLQAYTFPPFVLILQVFSKLFTYKGAFLTLNAPFWPQRE